MTCAQCCMNKNLFIKYVVWIIKPVIVCQAQYIFLHQSMLELLNNKGNSQSIWFVSYSALEKMDSLDAMEGKQHILWTHSQRNTLATAQRWLWCICTDLQVMLNWNGKRPLCRGKQHCGPHTEETCAQTLDGCASTMLRGRSRGQERWTVQSEVNSLSVD